MISQSKIQTAIAAVARARNRLSTLDPDLDTNEVYKNLERDLSRSLGNAGLSADFVNSAWALSEARERSRFGKGIPAKGMLYLFEEDDPGVFSILRMADDEGNVEEDPIATGRVKDGSLEAALEFLVTRRTHRFGR